MWIKNTKSQIENFIFIKMCKKVPHEVTQKDIRWYLGVLIRWNKSPSTVNLAHNALIFYYGQILKRKFFDIPFQKKHIKVKQILTKNEIKRLISSTNNLKHRLVMSMLYSTGARVSELIKIKVDDIYFEEKLLLVREGKGMKDRYTIISDKNILDIKSYLDKRKVKSDYLFEARGSHITAKTVQAILIKARRVAKVRKNVTPHVFRHSFATHLKDDGIEDSLLQKLMGHGNYKTTQTYARVTSCHFQKIKNPHDLLY